MGRTIILITLIGWLFGCKNDPAKIVWLHSKPANLEFTKSEITVAQYRACVNAGKCSLPRDQNKDKDCNWGCADRDNHPINCVDWHQATAFCKWVGGRLPEQQEWEAEASNGGIRVYPWVYQEPSCDYAIMNKGCGKDSTWPVCSKPSGNSVSGLCDMSGNVWEWTSSPMVPDMMGFPAFPEGSAPEWADRVLRGGSWYSDSPDLLRALSRDLLGRLWTNPTDRRRGFGFRCARSPK